MLRVCLIYFFCKVVRVKYLKLNFNNLKLKKNCKENVRFVRSCKDSVRICKDSEANNNNNNIFVRNCNEAK